LGESGHSARAANFSTNSPDSKSAFGLEAGHSQAMLTEIYIEALLVDEELADQVWQMWTSGQISDDVATIGWVLIASQTLYD